MQFKSKDREQHMTDSMETKQDEEVTILSKLTLAGMGLKGAAILGQPADVRSLLLATFFGKASGTKKVENKLTGDVYTALTGTFSAINHLDKDREYMSGVLYLPGGTHEMLLAAVSKLMDESEDVEFAVDVYAVRASSAVGFAYEQKPKMEAKGVDPLADMRARLFASKTQEAKTLEAPKVDPEKVEAPKHEPAKAEPAKPAVAARK